MIHQPADYTAVLHALKTFWRTHLRYRWHRFYGWVRFHLWGKWHARFTLDAYEYVMTRRSRQRP